MFVNGLEVWGSFINIHMCTNWTQEIENEYRANNARVLK